MPISRPSIADLQTATQARIKSALPTATFTRRSVLLALADAITGSAHLTLAFVEQAAKQAHPAFSEGDELTALARVWNLTRNPATAATVSLQITNYTGTTAFGVGSVFSVGSRQFTVTAGVLATGANAVNTENNFAARANDIGLIEPIAIDTPATVAIVDSGDNVSAKKITEFRQGTPAESDVQLRQRLAEQIRRPNLCGTREDWVAHLKAQAGVASAFARDAGGAVQLAWLYDRQNAAPSNAEVTAVVAALQQYRPAGVQIITLIPTAQTINIALDNFGLPPEYRDSDYIAARTRIRDAIRSLVAERRFIGGFSDDNNLPKSWIAEAASDVIPEVRFDITTPTANFVVADGKYPVIGNIDIGDINPPSSPPSNIIPSILP